MNPTDQPTAKAHIGSNILRIRAQNPSPLTGTGTNCYLIFGDQGAVLIDAGPNCATHVATILQSLQGLTLKAILITHPHQDHSGAARMIAAQTGAPIYGYGPASTVIRPNLSDADTEDHVDTALHVDTEVKDQQVIQIAGLQILAVHTPGHMHSHVCFGYQDSLFSGDHVMGWASSVVIPPDGDMAAYRASLHKLRPLGYARYLPGHGPVIDDPQSRLTELIAHRDLREAQILTQLGKGAATPAALAAQIYTDIPHVLLPAAAQNVLAHVIELAAKGFVIPPNHQQSNISCDSVFQLK